MPWSSAIFGLGLLVGTVATALAARWQIKRSLAKVRVAERRARSAERLAEIGAMTAGLAHEIKNPLSTIGLNAQLLAEGMEEIPVDRAVDAPSKQRLIRRIGSLRREAERVKGILSDFLSYAGELRLDSAPQDVNQVVEELVDFFSPQAQQQGVRLHSKLEASTLLASVDAPHLKQALLNLMLNAVQAMKTSRDEAGKPLESERPKELIIRTERHIEKLAGQPPDQSVRIHVIDTGPGIPPLVLERLFTPYFTTKAGGTGLGLATTRRIIEAHHGRIEAYSQPGVGTEFTITLPQHAPAAKEDSPRPRAP